MDQARFEAMVARLERESERSPVVYQLKVALLALLGFGLLGLILGTAGLGLLLLVGLVLAAVFTGGGALVLLAKFGKLLVLLAIPLWLLVRASVSALFVRLPPPQGHAIDRTQAPALFDAIDDMRRRMRGPRVHRVLITDDVNAAIVQQPLFGLVGWPRNYLLIGLPLLDSLTPDEALAVVAHEYGHLAGSHGRFSAFIYRLRHTWATVQEVSQRWTGWGGRILRAPLAWYAPFFNAYTFVLARANEYEADAASAALVGAPVAASALKRVNVSAPHYDEFLERTFDGLGDAPLPPADVSERWAKVAHEPPSVQAQRWLEAALEREPGVADTHPVLRARLRALGQTDTSTQTPPEPRSGASAAQSWLGPGLPAVREVLQTQWHDRVRDPWRARHDEIQADRARLAELRALPAPSADERVAALRLALQLEPDVDHGPALSAFHAEQPDHAAGLFYLGVWLLDHDDDTGLAHLDRAMALDPDAIKPAAERAYQFLRLRNDERAKAYADRWNARHEHDTTLAAQIETLDPRQPLQAPDLDPEELARVVALVQAHSKGVARAWLARRVIAADPSVRSYLIGLELTWWARRRGRQAAIVEQLATHEWPMHVFFVSLDGQFEPLKSQLEAGAGLPLVPAQRPQPAA